MQLQMLKRKSSEGKKMCSSVEGLSNLYQLYVLNVEQQALIMKFLTEYGKYIYEGSSRHVLSFSIGAPMADCYPSNSSH